MPVKISDLRERYGSNLPFQKLTKAQRELLRLHDIKEHTANLGDTTVEVRGINIRQGNPVLRLSDVCEYLRAANVPGFDPRKGKNRSYAEHRLPTYEGALGVKGRHYGNQSYTFGLPDSSRILVSFCAVKDRP